MRFMRQVSNLLDDEHRASISLLDRVDRALAGRDEVALKELAQPLVRQLEHEVTRHFRFEEQHLFPRMDEAGDGDLAALLAEEHDTLRAVAEELLPLARRLSGGALAAPDRTTLMRLANEMVERQVAHIQKETMALLPMLDDLLDDDSDRELAFAYAADA
ncbi:MAG: hemerythrin domain-containing protein [Leptothrix sp. (in: Bacteria)]|jgi:hemerythrin-like domain-containing protein|nr:hemerythrin domain-containing protein [Leptothrix sp. (in: b-proteobacteria)]